MSDAAIAWTEQAGSSPIEQGLANLLVVVADNKHMLGRHLSEWSVGAPGLEPAVAAAAISQGHLGQSRALYPLVDELLGPAKALGMPEESGRRPYHVSALDEPFDTWAEAVAALYLVDAGLDVVLRCVGEIGTEMTRRVERILDEAAFNHEYARERLAELTQDWPRGRDLLTPHLEPLLVEMSCWFGPEGEPGVETLVDAGVLTCRNLQMRERYLGVVVPPLVSLGYELPVGDGDDGWHLAVELPWQRWDRIGRRLTS